MSILHRAKGQWGTILRSIAPELIQGGSKHVSCPVHGGKDGFRLYADWEETGGGVCNTCGSFCNGVELLMWYLDSNFREVAKSIEQIIGRDETMKSDNDHEEKTRRLRKIQTAARTAGDYVTSYLSERGLEVPVALKEATLPYWENGTSTPYPAMCAKFVSPDNEPVTWHITYLDRRKKARVGSPRKIMPPIQPMTGGAVRLYPEGEILGIAEGIETAIAAKMLFDVPVWAALNASMLEKFKPPNTVKELLIFGDNDHSHAGQASAYILARRLWNRISYREVRIPSYPGDWNDVLLKEKGNKRAQ